MRNGFFRISIIGSLFLCGNVIANNACLLETNTVMMGIELDIKDCIQNAGMAEADLQAICTGVSEAAVAMGGPAAKITYLSSCPVPFQAKCDNTNTAKAVFFYYKRAADEAAGLKSSCELMKGIYTKGELQ